MKSIIAFLLVGSTTWAVQESQKVEHPQAAKGLIKIEKDGAYIYRTKPLETKTSSHIRIGTMPSLEISSSYTDATGAEQVVTFSDLYTGSSLPFFMYDYEWQPFRSSAPHLGLQLGGGLFVTEGNGRLKATNEVSEERYTFVGLPLNVGAVFRLQIGPHPWVAPYVAGGGTYMLLLEKRDDKSMPKGVGVPGIYGAGGLMLNLAAFDRETAYSLGSEYGIGNIWLVVEARYMKTFGDTLNMSNTLISGGFSVDF